MRHTRSVLLLAVFAAAVAFAAGCGRGKTPRKTEAGGKPEAAATEKNLPEKTSAGQKQELATHAKRTTQAEKVAKKGEVGSGAAGAKKAEGHGGGQEKKPSAGKKQAAKKQPAETKGGVKLVPLKLKLPKPTFVGTPKNIPPGTTVEIRKGKPKPVLVPKGVKNVALGKPVTASDEEPIIGKLDYVTDGNKESTEGSYVELGPGLQWVQIDLGAKYKIYAIAIWHYFGDPRVYHDVIVQVADDADFITNVHTVFNNDHDNSAGLGIGKDREYFETYQGKVIDAKGVVGRYVRLYSNGSTADELNDYIEVEVYGLPAK